MQDPVHQWIFVLVDFGALYDDVRASSSEFGELRGRAAAIRRS